MERLGRVVEIDLVNVVSVVKVGIGERTMG